MMTRVQRPHDNRSTITNATRIYMIHIQREFYLYSSHSNNTDAYAMEWVKIRIFWVSIEII